MALEIQFEINDEDLARFRKLFAAARKKAAKRTPEDLLGKTRELVKASLAKKPPNFVRTRLLALQRLVNMAEDPDWRLPKKERKTITDALAYFAVSDDLVEDDTPVIGLLDDAIAAELVLRGLRHELETYEEFSRYRETEIRRRKNAGKPTDISKEDWAADHRAALHSHALERRRADPTGWHVSTLFGV